MRYRIGMVARLTGMSTTLLRMWERRYQVVEPSRDGGPRLYSDADVERLKAIKRVVDSGHAIGTVATLSNEVLATLAQRADPPAAPVGAVTPGAFSQRFLDAISGMEVDQAERVLLEAASSMTAPALTADLLGPLLQEIGQRWADHNLGIAHEHAASTVIRSILGTLLRNNANPSAPVVVAATLSSERHELGALMAALVASSLGWRAIYVGPDLPAQEVVTAATQSGARVVLLSAVMGPGTQVRRMVATIRDALPSKTRILVGGNAVSRWRTSPRGVTVVPDLSELERALGPLRT